MGAVAVSTGGGQRVAFFEEKLAMATHEVHFPGDGLQGILPHPGKVAMAVEA
jgi:hypothetical protein